MQGFIVHFFIAKNYLRPRIRTWGA